MSPGQRGVHVVGAGVALLLGAFAATALLIAFTVVDDPCPGYDDEGAMAAPGSPYARVMCESVVTLEPVPMSQIHVPAATILAAGAAVVAAALLVRLRRRLATGARMAAALAGLFLLQPVLVLALQHTLPHDCLTGRQSAGECARDREAR